MNENYFEQQVHEFQHSIYGKMIKNDKKFSRDLITEETHEENRQFLQQQLDTIHHMMGIYREAKTK